MANREYPEHPRIGVGAVVVRDGKILLVKRNYPPAAGLWAIPGGLVELGETLQAAAERETLEETGIMIKARDPVYAFDLIRTDEGGEVRFHYVIVDLMADYVNGEPFPSDDAGEARWFFPEELEEIPVSPQMVDLLKKLGLSAKG
ncbi:MAG: NUDIX hydrolase [Syntrophales bacterium]